MESPNIYKLYTSTRKDKKYMIKHNNKTIHFGAVNPKTGIPMSDYTINKDNNRK